ncbi:hypothetical protein BGX34_000214 [Mortierella sp. NVP85]|nr:hypothetical protein BGX34_000214 [Mortierella sp. NVP85]
MVHFGIHERLAVTLSVCFYTIAALLMVTCNKIARGLVLPFTVAFSYSELGQRCSRSAIVACIIAVCGFYVGASSEFNFSGNLVGLASCVATALHAVAVRKSLPAVSNSSIDLVYYNNVLSLILMTPILLLSDEYSIMLDKYDFAGKKPFHGFIGAAVITGVLGFVVNFAGFLQISKASPASNMIAGVIRGVLQTLVGQMAFFDIINTGRLWGIALTLGAGALYTLTKDNIGTEPIPKPNYIPMTHQDVESDDEREK